MGKLSQAFHMVWCPFLWKFESLFPRNRRNRLEIIRDHDKNSAFVYKTYGNMQLHVYIFMM